jgi:predicted tellurium resistance membrane protein TerC
MDFVFGSEVLASLVTLTALEIVLGIDNIVVIAIVAGELPAHQRDRARLLGLALALVTRALLLLSISWIAGFVAPLFHVGDQPVSGRDLLMLFGGLFLLFKAVREIHVTVMEAGAPPHHRPVASFGGAITQIVVLDVVFSFDSVITAVGMANELWVMIAAVTIAIFIMMAASGPIVRFVNDYPTVKMLALAFVMLIGMALIAEGMEFHIPKGYLYFAMAFSVAVEALNVTVAKRRKRAAERDRDGR